jgi:hypothetical protein
MAIASKEARETQNNRIKVIFDYKRTVELLSWWGAKDGNSRTYYRDEIA